MAQSPAAPQYRRRYDHQNVLIHVGLSFWLPKTTYLRPRETIWGRFIQRHSQTSWHYLYLNLSIPSPSQRRNRTFPSHSQNINANPRRKDQQLDRCVTICTFRLAQHTLFFHQHFTYSGFIWPFNTFHRRTHRSKRPTVRVRHPKSKTPLRIHRRRLLLQGV